MPQHNAVAVILGGGAGTRLLPLTRDRAKPAVPLAGKYRLVDIPISNCINSGIERIYLLTQFNSVSLHRHVHTTYRFDPFQNGFVQILAAQQTPTSAVWFLGTADAVRQSLSYMMDKRPDYVVILSGDQLYRMNLAEGLARHRQTGADITIAAKPVPRADAGSLGIMEVDGTHRIVNFVEKPGDTPALAPLRAPMFDDERYLASMGIYFFNTDVLVDLLDNDLRDFGKDIIPGSIRSHKVFSYIFDGYWRDIGTIGSFWEANLELTDPLPEFSFYDEHAPIYTHMRFLPPSKINKCAIERTLISEGCIISGASIRHSVVGVRAVIGEGTTIEDSVVMGADRTESAPPEGVPPLGIGKSCVIRRAIIDKDARIGDGAVITPDGKPDGESTDLYTISDGIIVVPKNAVITAGSRL